MLRRRTDRRVLRLLPGAARWPRLQGPGPLPGSSSAIRSVRPPRLVVLIRRGSRGSSRAGLGAQPACGSNSPASSPRRPGRQVFQLLLHRTYRSPVPSKNSVLPLQVFEAPVLCVPWVVPCRPSGEACSCLAARSCSQGAGCRYPPATVSSGGLGRWRGCQVCSAKACVGVAAYLYHPGAG